MSRVGMVICFGTQLITGVRCAAAADVDLLDHFWKTSEVVSESPGSVLRMDLDVTGDGQAEVFLANSQKTGTSGVQEWHIYSKIGEGRYKLLGVLAFSYQLFLLKKDGPDLVAYYQDAGPMGSIVTYRVSESGFRQESTEGNVAAGTYVSAFASWRQEVGLKVLAAGLNDLSGTLPPNWRDLLSNEAASGVTSLEDLVVVE